MLKVTVKRSKWGRGNQKAGSRLLHSVTGKLCCMGFAALAAGFTKEQITDASTISGLRHGIRVGTVEGIKRNVPPLSVAAFKAYLKAFPYQGSIDPFDDLYHFNDSEDNISDDSEREALLIKHGKKVGIEFTFVD